MFMLRFHHGIRESARAGGNGAMLELLPDFEQIAQKYRVKNMKSQMLDLLLHAQSVPLGVQPLRHTL